MFAAVASNGFVDWDDGAYVFENPHVTGGLSRDGIAWAFTTFHSGNWHPLTWLSHMLDASLFGVRPGPMHVVNLALHVANALLLFAFFLRTTNALGRSAFVAALFAVHPLHVESVAWIAERKDVLSTLFLFLAMNAYLAWTLRPSAGRYAVVVAAFVAGLLAKPMLVTFPFLLLLLDVWPLRRDVSWRRRVVEKIPLFALSAAACVVALIAQHDAGAVLDADKAPLAARLANAAVSYVAYVGKTFAPTRLAALYPYESVSTVLALGAAALLVLASALAVRAARTRPWVAVGWLWFLGLLVPVVGLVQVGVQSMADRYTYVPIVGLFVVAAWGAAEIAERLRIPRDALLAGAVVAVGACALVARRQVDVWRDGKSLWTHAAEVTTDNLNAHVNLGCLAMAGGDFDSAETELREAVRIAPNSAVARKDLGLLLLRRGRAAQAADQFARVVAAEPNSAEAHDDLASALGDLGRFDEAIVELREAIRRDAAVARRHANLARLLIVKGERAAAAVEVETALRLDPTSPDARRAAGELGR